MTFTNIIASAPSSSVWEFLDGLRATLAKRAAQHRLYRATLADLDALSDRDLSDLGLARAEIGRVAREAAALA